MKILIADQQSIVRRGLRLILSDVIPDAEFTKAASADDALSALESDEHTVAILDLDIPGGNGLSLLKTIRSKFSELPLIVLGLKPEKAMASKIEALGARAYLNKAATVEEIADTLQQILETDGLVTPSNGHNLSKREHEVMRLLCQGKALKEIGAILNVSPKSVSTYRRRVLSKLGLNSNAELVQFAVSKRFLTRSDEV